MGYLAKAFHEFFDHFRWPPSCWLTVRLQLFLFLARSFARLLLIRINHTPRCAQHLFILFLQRAALKHENEIQTKQQQQQQQQ